MIPDFPVNQPPPSRDPPVYRPLPPEASQVARVVAQNIPFGPVPGRSEAFPMPLVVVIEPGPVAPVEGDVDAIAGGVFHGADPEAVAEFKEMVPGNDKNRIFGNLPYSIFFTPQGQHQKILNALKSLPENQRLPILQQTKAFTPNMTPNQRAQLFQTLANVSDDKRMKIVYLMKQITEYEKPNRFLYTLLNEQILETFAERFGIESFTSPIAQLLNLQMPIDPLILKEILKGYLAKMINPNMGYPFDTSILKNLDHKRLNMVIQVITAQVAGVIQTDPHFFIEVVAAQSTQDKNEDSQGTKDQFLSIIINTDFIKIDSLEPLKSLLQKKAGFSEEKASFVLEDLFALMVYQGFSYKEFLARHQIEDPSFTYHLQEGIIHFLKRIHQKNQEFFQMLHKLKSKGYELIGAACVTRSFAYLMDLLKIDISFDRFFFYDPRSQSYPLFIKKVQGLIPFSIHEFLWIENNQEQKQELQKRGIHYLFFETLEPLEQELLEREIL